MNFAKIYQDSISTPSHRVEESNESAQLIIHDERAQWLQSSMTVELMNFLKQSRQTLLEECVDNLGNSEVVKAKLIRVKLLKEIIDYASGNRR